MLNANGVVLAKLAEFADKKCLLPSRQTSLRLRAFFQLENLPLVKSGEVAQRHSGERHGRLQRDGRAHHLVAEALPPIGCGRRFSDRLTAGAAAMLEQHA